MSKFEDRAEIEYLHTIFAHAADRGDYDLLRSLYTDDATDDHGAYNGPIDGYIDWVKQTHESYDFIEHVYSRPVIFLDGDTAESEVKGLVFTRTKGPPAMNSLGVSRTFDKYRRTEQGWRFTSRAVCFDWMGPASEAEGDYSFVRLQGRMGSDDPIYTETPKLAAALREFSGKSAP